MATLNKFFTNILIFGLAMNVILYIFGAFNFDPQVQYPGSLSTMTSWFNLSPFNLLFTGATAAVVGVASLLLRQGTYAIYAMLLAALGMVIGPVQAFILAIPNAIGMWLPASTNPNPTLFPINPIVVVVGLIFSFAAYWFIFGLVIQRDLG
jgi:hypothetical protein